MTSARDCTSLICVQRSYRRPLLQPDAAFCCTLTAYNVNELTITDMRKWFKQKTTGNNKSDNNGNGGETEIRPQCVVSISLAAEEQAAASSCSLPPSRCLHPKLQSRCPAHPKHHPTT
ncbi:hypothetical protein ABVT39_024715 [Epinephelus coioides]